MDILDTSVIRGMRKRDILALRQDRRIAISPFTLWEILCHLDEVSTGEDAATAFGRRRGHVAVLHELECLHDPFADHAEAIGGGALGEPDAL